MNYKDTTIIGAGPAGIAAAIQLCRYGLDIALFEKDCVGGLLRNANLVENCPGFPGGISGRKMVERFQRSLGNFVENIIFEQVISLDYQQELFVATTDTREVFSRTAIIASGTRPIPFRGFDIPESVRDRLFYEVADLLSQKNKTFVIVGAGDAAFDYALNLTGPGCDNRAIIINRTDNIKALPLLQKRAEEHPAISYHPQTTLSAIATHDQARLSLKCDTPDGVSLIEADYLVFAIGREPQLGFVSASLRKKVPLLLEKGLLHLAGDVRNDIFRQSAISVGQGVMAAMEIYRHLKDHTEEK